MKIVKQLQSLGFFFVMVLSIGFLSSCETEIPDIDNEKPTVRLTITGPGINEVMDNPPREFWAADDGTQYLTLRSGVEYEFSLLAADAGGVSYASVGLPNFIDVTPNGAATITNVGIQQFITVTGDSSNPLTALGVSGTFTLPSGLGFDFNVTARDYGGESGSINSRYMTVTAFSN